MTAASQGTEDGRAHGASAEELRRASEGGRALAVVLLVAAALRLVHLWSFSSLPMADFQFRWTESDMAGYAAWADRIAAGDLIGRNPPHPYLDWMRQIAPPETWERWSGGAAVFHNAPLYPYLLAAVRASLGRGFWPIAIAQLASGLIGVALVFSIAERLFGRSAALLAGLAAAGYGPALLYDSVALRDGLGTTASLALLWALVRAETHAERARRWFAAGFLLAIALLAREATVPFVPLLLTWVVWLFWRDGRGLRRALAWLTAGAALGLAPLVARNLVVGAPPLALSSIGTLGLIYGQVADAAPSTFEMPDSAIRVLRESDGELRRALGLIWATYDGDWALFLKNQLARLLAALSSFEAWDNLNWSYYRARSPVLRFSLPFEAALALGVVGLVVERARPGQGPLRCFLVASLASLLVTSVIGRYRLPLAAVLLVYAGAALAWGAERARERRFGSLGLAAAAAVAIALGSRAIADPLDGGDRAIEYLIASQVYYERGDREAALVETRDGLRRADRGPGRTVLPPNYGQLAERFALLAAQTQHGPEAESELLALERAYPDDVNVQLLLGAVERDLMHSPERAEEHFQAAAHLGAR